MSVESFFQNTAPHKVAEYKCIINELKEKFSSSRNFNHHPGHSKLSTSSAGQPNYKESSVISSLQNRRYSEMESIPAKNTHDGFSNQSLNSIYPISVSNDQQQQEWRTHLS